MIDRLIAIVAYLTLVGFLAILVLKVPRVDLTLLVVVTLALAGWDLLRRAKR